MHQRLAADSTHVYWTKWSGGEVMKVPLAGGTPVVLASGQNQPHGIDERDADGFGGAHVMKDLRQRFCNREHQWPRYPLTSVLNSTDG